MKALIVVFLAVVFLSSYLLARVTKALPLPELRRRARGGSDKSAHAIYKLAAFGPSLDLFLWIVGSLSAAALILLAASSSWWLGLLVILLTSLLFAWPKARSEGLSWQTSAWLAPLVSKLVSWTQPILSRPASWLKKHSVRPHTRVYEKQDLLELLEKQNRQPDNRLTPAEIDIVHAGLTFGDKTVGSVMTPRKSVKLVAASDSIGPMLMDELHSSGLSYLPVVKEIKKNANPEIVGTLYLRDLVGHSDKGRVRDVMKKSVHFINEQQDLRQALAALLSTQNHLLIVVNNFEEFVGVLSIEDVVEQILGQKIVDEFDQHDDLRAVAAHEARPKKAEHSDSEVVE